MFWYAVTRILFTERYIIIYKAHFLHVSKHAHHLTLWKKISVEESKKTQEIKLFPKRDHLTHHICGMWWKLPNVSSFLALSNFPNWRVRLTTFFSFQSDLCHQGFIPPQLPCAHPLFHNHKVPKPQEVSSHF